MKSINLLGFSIVLAVFFIPGNKAICQIPIYNGDSSLKMILKRFESQPELMNDIGSEGGSSEMIKRMRSYWLPRVGNESNFQKYYQAMNSLTSISPYDCNGYVQVMNSWSNIGPWKSPNSSSLLSYVSGTGQIHSIAMDPVSSLPLYAASPFGGVFWWDKTENKWNPSGTDYDLPLSGVADIAVCPTNSQVVFAATGNRDDELQYSIGVYRSTNGSIHWSPVNSGLWNNITQKRQIKKILYHPTNPNIIYLATNQGIYKTINALSACIWTQIYYSLTNSPILGLEIDPNNTNILYASGKDIIKTTNGGASWVTITGSGVGLDLTNINGGETLQTVNIDYTNVNNANFVYALVLTRDYNHSPIRYKKYLYRFQSSTGLWTFIGQTPFPGFNNDGYHLYMSMETSPTNENELYFGEEVLRKWNGSSFTSMPYSGTGSIHPDVHYLKFAPDGHNLFIGNDGGIWKSDRALASPNYIDYNEGLVVGTILGLGTSPSTKDFMMIGEQDCGTNIFDNRVSNTNPNKWRVTYGGDGFEQIILKNDLDVFSVGNYQGMVHNSDGWSTAISAALNNLPSLNPDWDYYYPAPYNYSYKTSKLYGGFRNIWTNSNPTGNSISWNLLSNFDDFIPSTTYPCALKLSAFQFANSDENYIYACSAPYVSTTGCYLGDLGSKVFKTTVGGIPGCSGLPNHCWTDITPNIVPSNYFLRIMSLVIHPDNPDRVWVCNGGYDANFRVFYTPDGGTTWQDFSAGLPSIPVNTIVYEQGSNDGLYCGTDAGVYYRNATMSSWCKYTGQIQGYHQEMPNVSVRELEISNKYNKLRAATYGRGLWEGDLACPPNLDLSLSGNVTSDEWKEASRHVFNSEIISSGKVVNRGGYSVNLLPGFIADASSATGNVNMNYLGFIHACGSGTSNSPMRIGQNTVYIDHNNEEEQEEVDESINLMINPNPNSGIFQLKLNGSHEDGVIAVYNSMGGIVKNINIIESQESMEINLGGVPRGIYVLKFTSVDFTQVVARKVVIE